VKNVSPQQSGADDRGDPGAVGPRGSDNAKDELATRTGASGEAVAGTVIGLYHLLQPIGQGGMGEVWLAEQKEPVRRRVAVKLIKAGMDTREVVARFESERQALALMDHPTIAKVFDAGSTPQGRPYFVMEYVTGIPITDYCDKHKMTPRERLELFIQVCQGVQHAHQKAIIHRDLKPSNILVGEVDGKPMPRIIDFGVAKATSQRLTAETLFTRVGAIVGTPGYISPEQADSTGVDIDTRTDVYSLGVVLYELLVGALPLDFRNVAFQEVLRRLREEDAPSLSTRLRSLGEQSSLMAKNRGTDPAKLVRQLQGDVDVITLKALEKDRSRRYSTPSELAGDIGRYLRNEPVMARPASAAYRARKYLRRHRISVAVAAAIAVLLVFFAVAQAFEVQRITRERDRADRIATFMTDMFHVSDPSTARGNTITAREILDKASQKIDTGLANDPELQAQMMQVMGEVYEKLGLYSQAQSLLTRALDIRHRVLGPQNPETLDSMGLLGWILTEQGRYAEAEKLQRETLDIRRRVLGPEHPDTLASMNSLFSVLEDEGRHQEAEKLQRETLEVKRRVLGPEHPNTLGSMNNLALVLMSEGRFAEAEKLLRETVDLRRRVLGSEHPDTLSSKDNLSVVLEEEGRHQEAEKSLRETLEIERRVWGPEHPDTLKTMIDLGQVLNEEGRLAEAEKLNREVLEIERRVLGPEHPDTAATIYNLGCIAAHKGKRDEAFSLLRAAVDHGLAPTYDLEIEKDSELKSLHGDPRFDALVARAKERAAAAQKPK
jgi:serine/threonine protein kinase